MLLSKLQGIVPAKTLQLIRELTGTIFSEDIKVRFPEAWLLYTQNIIAEPHLREILETLYKCKFTTLPRVLLTTSDTYNINNKHFIPLKRIFESNTIILGTLPEFLNETLPLQTVKFKVVPLTLYDYINAYKELYNSLPEFVTTLTTLDSYRLIIDEALQLGVADITIADRETVPCVYYNINKRKVYSKRLTDLKNVVDLADILAYKAGSTIPVMSIIPTYFTVNINKNHRARTVVNKTYNGYVISQRILNNHLISSTYDSLNINRAAQDFLYKNFVNQRPGLKIIAGPTYSGKNTTLLTTLKYIHDVNDCKIVSVENPVEILTDFIEQIDSQTDDEFVAAVNSIIRQNPDIVYITEITRVTATETIKIANTAKAVFTTIHCNTVADIPIRLQQLSDMPISEIIENLDSLIHQDLIPKKCPVCNDEGCPECYKAGVIPVLTYLRITPEMKRKMLEMSTPELLNYLNLHTEGKDSLKNLYDQRIISNKTYEWRNVYE